MPSTPAGQEVQQQAVQKLHGSVKQEGEILRLFVHSDDTESCTGQGGEGAGVELLNLTD